MDKTLSTLDFEECSLAYWPTICNKPGWHSTSSHQQVNHTINDSGETLSTQNGRLELQTDGWQPQGLGHCWNRVPGMEGAHQASNTIKYGRKIHQKKKLTDAVIFALVDAAKGAGECQTCNNAMDTCPLLCIAL